MPKQETGISDTGESENPLNQKRRRTTYSHQADMQAQMGDGVFPQEGARGLATNMGKPMMLPAARRRRGMR